MIARISLSFFLLILAANGLTAIPQHIPKSNGLISIWDFGQLMTVLSEPEGYFDSDNFVSNEAAYLKVLPGLKRLGVRGGIYLGVGPDQNYSYIAAIKPEMAILIDIRRQNVLQHLYYKALFQLSADRLEYLERLFGKRIAIQPASRAQSSVTELLDLIDRAPADSVFSRKAVADACQLIKEWNLGLDSSDYSVIRYIAEAFIEAGPDLKFTSYGRAPRPQHPTYRLLLEETDSRGVQSSFMAQETSFQDVKRLHHENRIIPIVGDLGGLFALRRTAEELRRRHLQVVCFYVSNVEFYLFGGSRWNSYVRNIRDLPWAPNGILIRSYANMWRPHPAQTMGYYMTSVLQLAHSFLENEGDGKDQTYWDLVTKDYIDR